MIYFIPLLFVLYGVFALDMKSVSCESRIYKRIEAIVFALLVLVPGLSFRIGVDTPSYMMNYDIVKPIQDISWQYLDDFGYEYLWTIFIMLCKSITPEFAFMHTVQCLMFVGSVFYFIRQFSEKHFIAYLFFVSIVWIHMCFGALRESLAVSFFLIGLSKLLKEDNYVKYCIFALVGIFFHRFAFIPIAIAPAALLYNRNKVLASILLFSVATYVIMNFDSLLLSILNDDTERVQYYMEQTESGSLKLNIIGMVNYIVELALPSLFLFLIYKKTKSYVFFSKQFACLFVLVFVIGCVASNVDIFRRVYYYFLPFVAVAVSNLIYNAYIYADVKQSYLYKAIIIIAVYSCAMGNINFCKPTVLETRENVKYNAFYFPYSSVVTKEIDPTREAIHRY